ncbi:MAG: helix-turn-helix domain-containing protein [Clostridia bacterium]|nr:helix-turn-helix domain-containing protein [Clostridia bacterium]
MGKKLIARVIMMADCSVHIAVRDGNTFECTPDALSFLLSDPYGYIEAGPHNEKNTCNVANPKHLAFPYIKGLTLIKIYDDIEIVCVFPKVYQALLESKALDNHKQINLSNYISSMDLSDEKHFLMKFFCEFNNSPHSKLVVNRKLNLDFDVRSEIVTETINNKFFEYKEDPSKSTDNLGDDIEVELPLFKSNELDSTTETGISLDNYLTTSEFANLHNVSRHTVISWIKKDKLPGTIKPNNRWHIPKDTSTPMDGRAGRTMPSRSKQGVHAYEFLGDDYTSVQEYIKKKECVSDNLRKYIRSYEEFNYYVAQEYREVNWDNKPALIIDINPDYYCKRLGLTNRELINRGKSPVAATEGEPEFHIHHIGQKEDSPFCIISKDEHSVHTNTLHDNSSTDWRVASEADLHGPKFAAAKMKFWIKYLEEYDAAGKFSLIRGSRSIRPRKPVI